MATDGGQVALVTAAAHGIGAATCAALVAAGWRVVMADIDEEGLRERARQLDSGVGAVTVVPCDATTEAGAAAAVEAAVATHGRLDALINVVGGSRPGKTVLDLELAEWERWVSLNLTSVFLMSRAALPHLLRQRGRIVNVSSGAGLRGMRANPAYIAAKAAVVALTRAMAIDHGPDGVRVNCVAPGPIRTPLMERNRSEAEIGELGKLAVLGRIGLASEIADAIVWLAGDRSTYVTGQTIEVDGGPAPQV